MIGISRTLKELVIENLTSRFQDIPQELIEKINDIRDLPLLKELVKQAITASSLQEFQNLLLQAQG